MRFTVGFLHILSAVLAFAAGKNHHNPPPEMHCIDHRCPHDQACKLSNIGNVLYGECIHRHGPDAPQYIIYGCPQTLPAGQSCVCDNEPCIHNVFQGGSVQKGGHPPNGPGQELQCGHHNCKHDEVCVHEVHHERELHSSCHKLHDQHQGTFGCATLPTEHHPCYCITTACNTELYNKYYHQHTQVNNHNFQCGDHICYGAQVCTIKKDWHNNRHHLKCEDHIPHNSDHCLPNLFMYSDSCYCESRTCVDQTLISIIQGLHISGIVCPGNDLHVCHAGQVCELRHVYNGVFSRHCADGRHTKECTRAPHVGEVCHCSTQMCVFGKFTGLQTTTPIPAVTSTVAVQNPTTAGMVTTHAPQQNTTAMATQTPSPVATTEQTTTPVVTASTVAPTTVVATCTDVEDGLFSCATYDAKYNMCGASTGTLFTVANKRCRNYCGICSGNGGAVNSAATVSTVTHGQPVCVDHDTRCKQYQHQLCSTTVSQAYVIATCPLTCNKCTEYFDVTTTPAPLLTNKCFTCGDIDSGIPCYSREVFDNRTSSATTCTAGHSFCMTDIMQDSHGNTDVFKRCVTEQVCNSKWINESADLDYCSKYGTIMNPGAFECHFCCKGDACNTGIKPPSSVLVAKPTGK